MTRPPVLATLGDPLRVGAAMLAAALAEPPDRALDRLCARVAEHLEISTVVINVVLDSETRAVGSAGLPALLRRVPVRHSICSYVAAQQQPLLVEQPAAEDLLTGCVARRLVHFYAGHPIRLHGHVIGALGAADRRRRHDGDQVLAALADPAREVERELASRRAALPS